MSPPSAIVSSSGCGANTITRGRAGRPSGVTVERAAAGGPAAGGAVAAVLHGGRLARQESRGLDPGRHVGELQLDRLVLADRLAEGGPLLRIVDRVLERGLRDADGTGRDVDPPDLEPGEHLLEPPSL